MRYWYKSDKYRGEITYTSKNLYSLDDLKEAIREIESSEHPVDDERILTEPISLQILVRAN